MSDQTKQIERAVEKQCGVVEGWADYQVNLHRTLAMSRCADALERIADRLDTAQDLSRLFEEAK